MSFSTANTLKTNRLPMRKGANKARIGASLTCFIGNLFWCDLPGTRMVITFGEEGDFFCYFRDNSD